MALPFAAGLTGVQDSGGTLATFTDSSLYGALSNEGYTTANFVRTLILKDAYGNVLATISLTGTTLSATYPMTADQWITGQLFLAGINPTPNYQTAVIGFPFDRITKNLYRNLLKPGCCQNKNIKERIDNANNYLFGSAIEGLSGNGAGFNVDVQNAYAYLNAPVY